MGLNGLRVRTVTLILAGLLLFEVALIVLLRTLGWFGTGNALQLFACIFANALPLLVAFALLLTNKFRFSLRSLVLFVTMVGVFLSVSLAPLLDYRFARKASMQLVSANATLNEWDHWDDFYARMDLPPPPRIAVSHTTNVPPWLKPLVRNISTIPPDDAVRSVFLNSDAQVEILATHWQRFPSLQSVTLASGVSKRGLEVLRGTLPRVTHLDSVLVADVAAPKHWYRSLTNVRMLWVWGEGASRGAPFPNDHLADISELPNLEVFMVLGYAFDDSDARALSTSRSIKRIILRGTAVTPAGESELADESLERIVYRN